MKQKKSSYKPSEYTIDLVNQDFGVIVSSPDPTYTIKNTEKFLKKLNRLERLKARVRERLHQLRKKGVVEAIFLEGSNRIEKIVWKGLPEKVVTEKVEA